VSSSTVHVVGVLPLGHGRELYCERLCGGGGCIASSGRLFDAPPLTFPSPHPLRSPWPISIASVHKIRGGGDDTGTARGGLLQGRARGGGGPTWRGDGARTTAAARSGAGMARGRRCLPPAQGRRRRPSAARGLRRRRSEHGGRSDPGAAGPAEAQAGTSRAGGRGGPCSHRGRRTFVAMDPLFRFLLSLWIPFFLTNQFGPDLFSIFVFQFLLLINL
jgi:hypothetical protein